MRSPAPTRQNKRRCLLGAACQPQPVANLSVVHLLLYGLRMQRPAQVAMAGEQPFGFTRNGAQALQLAEGKVAQPDFMRAPVFGGGQ